MDEDEDSFFIKYPNILYITIIWDEKLWGKLVNKINQQL